MYSLRKTIKGITKITLDPQTNSLATQSDDNEVSIDFKNIVSISTPINFSFFQNKLYISDWEGKYWITNLNQVIESGEGRGYTRIDTSHLSCTYLLSRGKLKTIINTNNEVVFEYPISTKGLRAILEQDCFYCNESNTLLQCIQYKRGVGEILWTFDVTKDYVTTSEEDNSENRINLIVGIFQEQLIVLLKYGVFVSLDTKTGALLWSKDQVDLNNTNKIIDFGFGNPHSAYYDTEKGYIYILEGLCFISFDLNARVASYEWVSDNYEDVCSPDAMRISRTYIHENRIYFIASVNSFLSDTIGVFDIQEKKVIWQYKFELGKFNNIVQIESNGDTIYVRDHQNNLYIFDKR